MRVEPNKTESRGSLFCCLLYSQLMPFKLKPIVPRKGFLGDIAALERAIDQALDDTADYTRDLFEQTWATWEHKPTAVVSKTQRGRSIYTRDKIWNMLNKGTRPHAITPKRAKVLHFRAGSRAKTRPGVIRAGAGKAGGTPVFTKRVMHPGTEPRAWDEPIAEKSQPELGKNMRKNLKGLFK